MRIRCEGGAYWKFLGMAALLLLSCTPKKEKAFSDDQLAALLADIHIAEAAVYNIYGATKDSLIQKYYRQAFQMHQVEEDAFRQTIEYLEKHPEEMEAVYEKVLERLKKLEAQSEEKK